MKAIFIPLLFLYFGFGVQTDPPQGKEDLQNQFDFILLCIPNGGCPDSSVGGCFGTVWPSGVHITSIDPMYFYVAYEFLYLPGNYIDLEVTFQNYFYIDTSGSLPAFFELTFKPIPTTITGSVTLIGGQGSVDEVMIQADTLSYTQPDATGNYRLTIDLDNIFTPIQIPVTASLNGYTSSTIDDIEIIGNDTIKDINFELNYIIGIDHHSAGNYKFYPNPTHDNIIIECNSSRSDEISVSLLDLNGRIIFQDLKKALTTGSNSFEINLSGIEPGIYLLNSKNKDGYTTKKIIIN
jgi:hypothetical protein